MAGRGHAPTTTTTTTTIHHPPGYKQLKPVEKPSLPGTPASVTASLPAREAGSPSAKSEKSLGAASELFNTTKSACEHQGGLEVDGVALIQHNQLLMKRVPRWMEDAEVRRLAPTSKT